MYYCFSIPLSERKNYDLPQEDTGNDGFETGAGHEAEEGTDCRFQRLRRTLTRVI